MSDYSPHQQVVNLNAGGAEDKLLLGLVLIALGETCFVFLGVFVKQASSEIPLVQILFFRNLFALFFLGIAVQRTGVSQLKSNRNRLHICRALIGVCATFLLFYCFSELKLAEATLLKTTAPIMIPFVAWFLLNEQVGKLTLVAIFMAFIGIIVIIAPAGLSFSANLGFLSGLTAALLASLAKVIVRKLGTTEPSKVIVFYFALYGTLITAPICWYFWQDMSHHIFAVVVLCAICASAGQLFVTKAYTIAKAGQVGMFSYVSMPIAGLLGWLIWSESITSSLVAGSLMILAAGYLNYREFQNSTGKTTAASNTNLKR